MLVIETVLLKAISLLVAIFSGLGIVGMFVMKQGNIASVILLSLACVLALAHFFYVDTMFWIVMNTDFDNEDNEDNKWGKC